MNHVERRNGNMRIASIASIVKLKMLAKCARQLFDEQSH